MKCQVPVPMNELTPSRLLPRPTPVFYGIQCFGVSFSRVRRPTPNNLGQCRCHHRDPGFITRTGRSFRGALMTFQAYVNGSNLVRHPAEYQAEQSCGRKEGSMYLKISRSGAGMLTTSMRCSASPQAPLLCSHCEPYVALEEDTHPSESSLRCMEVF